MEYVLRSASSKAWRRGTRIQPPLKHVGHTDGKKIQRLGRTDVLLRALPSHAFDGLAWRLCRPVSALRSAALKGNKQRPSLFGRSEAVKHPTLAMCLCIFVSVRRHRPTGPFGRGVPYRWTAIAGSSNCITLAIRSDSAQRIMIARNGNHNAQHVGLHKRGVHCALPCGWIVVRSTRSRSACVKERREHAAPTFCRQRHGFVFICLDQSLTVERKR